MADLRHGSNDAGGGGGGQYSPEGVSDEVLRNLGIEEQQRQKKKRDEDSLTAFMGGYVPQRSAQDRVNEQRTRQLMTMGGSATGHYVSHNMLARHGLHEAAQQQPLLYNSERRSAETAATNYVGSGISYLLAQSRAREATHTPVAPESRSALGMAWAREAQRNGAEEAAARREARAVEAERIAEATRRREANVTAIEAQRARADAESRAKAATHGQKVVVPPTQRELRKAQEEAANREAFRREARASQIQRDEQKKKDDEEFAKRKAERDARKAEEARLERERLERAEARAKDPRTRLENVAGSVVQLVRQARFQLRNAGGGGGGP